MDDKTTLSLADRDLLEEIGGEPLAGSGFEFEMPAVDPAVEPTRQPDLRSIGSVRCFLHHHEIAKAEDGDSGSLR